MKKLERIILYPTIALVFILAVIFDLKITQGLYAPENLFGKIFEAGAENPAYWVATLACVLCFRFVPSTGKKPWDIALKVFFAIGAIGAAVYGGNHFRKLLCRNAGITLETLPKLLVIAGVALFHLATTYLVTLPLKKEAVGKNGFYVGIMIIAFFALSLAIMQGLKLLWLRPRYRTLVALYGEADAASYWKSVLQPVGFWNFKTLYSVDALGQARVENAMNILHITSWGKEEFYSFPSGHTMNALATLCLSVVASLYPRLKNKGLIIRIVCYVFGLATAISRIVRGAHNLTDVSFGYLLGIGIFDFVSTVVLGKIIPSVEKRFSKKEEPAA